MALKYQVAILNVWWNRGEVDTRLFSTKDDRDFYFNSMSPYWNSLNNFNIRDNITTTIVFRDDSGRTIDELLKCNYAIVRHLVSENTYTYRYYYIVHVEQDSNNQVVCTIDLDDVQNNLYDLITQNSPFFVNNWTGYNYKSNGWINYYPLEMINAKPMAQVGDRPSLYNMETNTIKVAQSNSDEVNTWLYNNVLCWDYIFNVDNNKIAVPEFELNSTWALEGINSLNYIRNDKMQHSIKLPYGSISSPVYVRGSTHSIYLKYNQDNADRYIKLTPLALQYLYETSFSIRGTSPVDPARVVVNYIGTYGIERKYSNICPLPLFLYNSTNMEIDQDGDLIITFNLLNMQGRNEVLGPDYICRAYLGTGTADGHLDKNSAGYGFVSGFYQTTCDYEAKGEHSLDIYDVPDEASMKILDKEYSKLRVRVANQSYDYNPLALLTDSSTNEIDFIYTETLKAGLSKIYLRPKGTGLYTEAEESDYTGLVCSMDLTEPLLNNQWADYFASHKNYYMQTNFNNYLNLAKGSLGLASSNSELGAITSLGGSGYNFLGSIVNQELDRDNMQQSPNSIANSNGDPYFNMAVSDIRPKLDTITCQDLTRQSVLSKFMLQGMPFNNLMLPVDVFYSHKNYDAISCTIYLAPNMSTKEFERLKAYLQNNHRYWYTDTIDFKNPYIK